MVQQKLKFEEFQDTIVDMLGIEKEVITKEAVIYNEIGIDSLGLVNLGVKIQKKYNIEIPSASIVEIRTVGELYDIINNLL